MQPDENTRPGPQKAHSIENLAVLLRSWLTVENKRPLRIALSVVLLGFAGWWVIGWSMRHLAQARLRPSRAAYGHLLAETRAAVGPNGTIVIKDNAGAFLSLTIDFWKEVGGRPSVPFTYEFHSHYDDIVISPEDNPWISTSDADSGMNFVPTAGLTLNDKPDASLSQAINMLVALSSDDAQSGAEPRYDIVANDDDSNVYFVRCDAAKGLYYLLLRHHRSYASLQAMQSASSEGDVIPVTSYHRAHLWRYLIDHYDEIKHLAENYLSTKRAEAPKLDNS